MWPFLSHQFLKSKKLRLNHQDFMDGDKGIEYLLTEIEKQKKENPIDNSDIGSHVQRHLEGWRFGPKNFSTLQGFLEIYKRYTGQEPTEILQSHFQTFLEEIFKIKEIEEPLCSFK